MKDEYIDKIIEVGRKGECTSQEFSYFLPNFPTLHGSEHIFSLSKFNSPINNSSVSFLEDIIKGLHLIEMKYREVARRGDSFGFGSPSRTDDLIEYLRGIDENKAVELFNWIAFNGGNYYIDPNISFEERKKRKQEAKIRRIEILESDKRHHLEAVARRKQVADLHSKRSDETQRLYRECKERLQKMSDEQLIDSFNKDVGNPGWVSARARFHSAMYEEFMKRGFDFSAFGNRHSLSFKNKVKLVGKNIVIDENIGEVSDCIGPNSKA